MTKRVRVAVNRREVRRLAHNSKFQTRAGRDAELIANYAAELAPKDTGAGAASIHAEGPERDGSWRISWDLEHDYMRFQELGTEDMPAHPFLRPAADRLSR
jgi:HK97 gp10 family phage protein